jgi:hypothetical protein
MDILVMNMNEPPSLLRNDVAGKNLWLKVQLVKKRSAIGSRVTAQYGSRRQAQEVTAQASFYSANDRQSAFWTGFGNYDWSHSSLDKRNHANLPQSGSGSTRGHQGRGRNYSQAKTPLGGYSATVFPPPP